MELLRIILMGTRKTIRPPHNQTQNGILDPRCGNVCQSSRQGGGGETMEGDRAQIRVPRALGGRRMRDTDSPASPQQNTTLEKKGTAKKK